MIVGKVPKECLAGQFQCASGECIDAIFKCDSQQDCYDGSDEKNCRMYFFKTLSVVKI
jgi:integrin beta 2